MADKRTSTITRHELELGDNTRKFLERILSGPIDGTSINQKLDAVFKAINNLDRKVDIMSSNIDRIEKEAADAAENVGLIKTAMEGLRTVADEMKAEIAALKEQVAQGQIDQARLDAAAATFEKADDDIDALVLPPSTGGGETGGETGGGTEG